MDSLPPYITTLINQNPTLQSLATNRLTTHLTSQLSTLVSTLQETHLSNLRSQFLNPYIIDPIATLLSSSTPSLVSALLLVLTILVFLQILDYARRVVMFWVMLVVKLVWWSFIIGAATWIYYVGVEKAGRDALWAVGALGGFVEGLILGNDGAVAGGVVVGGEREGSSWWSSYGF